jgi:competence protein ComEC
MGSLLLWAMKNGRLANAQNAIIFSAGVMLLINPLLLRYDIGFQLSFLATMGIVYFSPFLENQTMKKYRALGIWEILILTLSAQVFVLPIILFNFKNLSLVSPLANLLVLPIIPLTMFLGFGMIVFQFIFPPLAVVFSWLTFLPLKYETTIIQFLAGLEYSSLTIENFPWLWVWGWYIIIGAGLFFLNNAQKKNNL